MLYNAGEKLHKFYNLKKIFLEIFTLSINKVGLFKFSKLTYV